MKIVFDIDGTLTDFEAFIIENRSYIEEKYAISLTNFDGYDIDGMFDLQNKYNAYGRDIKDDFWNKYYLSYLMYGFRKGVKETFDKLTNEGYETIIVTSRNKTCDKNIVGKIVRYSTIWKLKKERIRYNEIIFCQSDEAKLKCIEKMCPDIIVDDKVELLNAVSEGIERICIASGYNREGLKEGIFRITGYEEDQVYNIIEGIRKKKKMHNNVTVAYPDLRKSERIYRIIRLLAAPFLKCYFRPVILHKENIPVSGPLIYAPNHRSTLDPYFITYLSRDAIHWNALKRFFTGEDSIFNNNKNFFLRKLTALLFKELGYIPVERGGNNREAIEITNYCLKNGSSVGIFPEGTTNKKPKERELLPIKNGIFYFSKNNDVEIQPISIVWFPKGACVPNKVVINYRKPFSMKGWTIGEGRQKWIEAVSEGIEESRDFINSQIKGKRV